MSIFRVRNNAESYGYPIGVLLVNCKGTPFIPGDVANASTYDFPVLYKTVEELILTDLLEKDDPALGAPVIKAAIELEKMGVKAITSDCGYMVRFQEVVSRELNIPVFLSSLLQVPLLSKMLGRGPKVGIICASKKRLTKDLLWIAGITDDIPISISGLESRPHFKSAMLDEEGSLNFEAVQKEVVDTAMELVHSDPGIGIILLECSNLPPYASAVQEATGKPVFDFVTMINYMHDALYRKPFIGVY